MEKVQLKKEKEDAAIQAWREMEQLQREMEDAAIQAQREREELQTEMAILKQRMQEFLATSGGGSASV